MSPKVALSLLVIALSLGAYIVFVDARAPTTSALREREGKLLPIFRREEVTRVEVTTSEGSVALEGQNDNYHLVAPRSGEAELPALLQLFATLETAAPLRKVENIAEAAPRATVVVQGKTFGYRIVTFGPAPSPEGAAYVRVAPLNDGKAEGYVVSRGAAESLLRSSDAYRGRRLLPFGIGDTKHISVSSKEGAFELEKFAQGGPRAFRIPNGSRYSLFAKSAIERFEDGMRADVFLHGDDEKRFLNSQDAAIKVVLRGDSSAEFAFFGECPNTKEDVVVVRRTPEPAVACVSQTVMAIALAPARVADTRLVFASDVSTVAEFAVKNVQDATALDLARDGGGFKLRAPTTRLLLEAGEVDAAASYIKEFLAARGVVAKEKPPERGKLVLEVLALVRDGALEAREERIQIYEAPDKAFAFRNHDDGVIILAREDLANLIPNDLTLKPLALFADHKNAGEMQKFESTCAPTQDWSQKNKGDSGATAIALAESILRGSAKKWVRGSFEPVCRITLAYEGWGERTIEFGAKRDDDTRLARLSSDKSVLFLAGPELYEGTK